jgi:predicted metallopeptidase
MIYVVLCCVDITTIKQLNPRYTIEIFNEKINRLRFESLLAFLVGAPHLL